MPAPDTRALRIHYIKHIDSLKKTPSQTHPDWGGGTLISIRWFTRSHKINRQLWVGHQIKEFHWAPPSFPVPLNTANP